MKLSGFIVPQKMAFSLSGRKREEFKKGAKILVNQSEKLTMLRLGLRFIADREVSFDDVFTKDFMKKYEAELLAQAETEEAARQATEPDPEITPETTLSEEGSLQVEGDQVWDTSGDTREDVSEDGDDKNPVDNKQGEA